MVTLQASPGRIARMSVAALSLVLAGTLLLAPASRASGPKPAFDRAFMSEMISHHGMAVDMGEMAVEKAVHPELKAVAEDIVKSQSAEIKLMQRLLKRWYGVSVKPRMTHDDEMDMAELDAATGSEFELRFMSLMTVHHTLAIERARIATKRAGHKRVRQLARAIVMAQKREVKQFREWTVAWCES